MHGHRTSRHTQGELLVRVHHRNSACRARIQHVRGKCTPLHVRLMIPLPFAEYVLTAPFTSCEAKHDSSFKKNTPRDLNNPHLLLCHGGREPGDAKLCFGAECRHLKASG
jgi:hypothetical protein